MFPPLRVSFSGVNQMHKYIIAMDIVPTDSKRYRYAYHRSSWLVAGKADPPVQSRLFIHPDGPFTCESLYKQIVSFEKVKLTNNEMDKCGHVRKLDEFKLILSNFKNLLKIKDCTELDAQVSAESAYNKATR